ncbi:hypothetical protein NA57DRAFT_77004 [Rhizodiscina lignyota]|uniref:Uncharacterized protein n=1 Tax=Rhizodiscina lignyota TaxID=1504668 RepID=A0A9P4IAE2_9PEZI|nr:hypothetical protein NA57DRAFT_77004 [Rhizodiscina lignyota]
MANAYLSQPSRSITRDESAISISHPHPECDPEFCLDGNHQCSSSFTSADGQFSPEQLGAGPWLWGVLSKGKQLRGDGSESGNNMHAHGDVGPFTTIFELGSPAVNRLTRRAARNLCALGLGIAAIIAIVAIGFGAYLVNAGALHPPAFLKGTMASIGMTAWSWPSPDDYYLSGHRALQVSHAAAILIGLLLNYALTAVFDCMGRVHSTALRWSLWEEGRLRFNSNPRLFAVSHSHAPNKWYTNVISAASLVFAYGSLALLTTTIQVLGFSEGKDDISSAPYDGPEYGIDISGMALLVVGCAIFIQFMISMWSLLANPKLVKTWSSNPLVALRSSGQSPAGCAGLANKSQCGILSRSWTQISRTIRLEKPGATYPAQAATFLSDVSVSTQHSSSSAKTFKTLSSKPGQTLIRPNKRQPSARDVVAAVRRINIALWLLFSLSAIFVIIVAVASAIKGQAEESYVQIWSTTGANLAGYWAWFGQIWFKFADLTVSEKRELLGIFIQSCFQAPLVLGLHYCELLTNVLRDERAWRRASRNNGTKVDPNWCMETLLDWPALLLFAFKGLVQWIFAYALSVNYVVVVDLLPLIVLTFLLFVLAAAAEGMARYHPKGAQPSTYGDLQLLAQLIEDMNCEKIYWGDKGWMYGDVRITGTASSPLNKVRYSKLYYGFMR